MIEITEKDNDCFHVISNGRSLGTIRAYSNTYHATYTYLSLDLLIYPSELASTIFSLLAEKVGTGFQVMLDSSQTEPIDFLKTAGFSCKRKCYEIEIRQSDFDMLENSPRLKTALKHSSPFQTCALLQLNHYKQCHQDVSPWTASDQAFIHSLPELLYYEEDHGQILAAAFLDKEEIAYVYGRDKQTFKAFVPKLLNHAFKHYSRLTLEVDDCDEIAMELGNPFIHAKTESWDTYILPARQ